MFFKMIASNYFVDQQNCPSSNWNVPVQRRRMKFKHPPRLYVGIMISLIGLWTIESASASAIARIFGRRSCAFPPDSCQSDAECPTNSICDYTKHAQPFGICICRSGYVAVAGNETRECYPVAEVLGDSCMYDIQCHERFSTESECAREQRCNCKAGSHHVPQTNVCYKSVQIGDFCRLTNNCIGGASCQRGICTCPYLTHANQDYTECIPDRSLDEDCLNDRECVTSASQCYDGFCKCTDGYVPSENRSNCLKKADRLYHSCEETIQCQSVPNSFCDTVTEPDQGFCQCRPHFHNVNNMCFVTVELHGICSTNENCDKSAGAICKDNHCLCDDDFPAPDGYCMSALGTASTSHQRITSHAKILITLLFILYY